MEPEDPMWTPGGQTKSQRMPEGEKTVAVEVAVTVTVSRGFGLAVTDVANRPATRNATEAKRMFEIVVDWSFTVSG